ncbi:DUF502 domain-containing protein [Pelagicoccus sp. SDUM812002]|uniref:DUF502 domain-containing protein n=1 Tax=Pelagicoccus sp. SDUM812002 TaxID=3041266 RepID=UPI00280F9A6A|nr:DUF502 domain-containing protein [Pelagicoccus sp. SDUM812002]MDQ8186941.1 DUF502 domain-containing protein [Pelagicoccus sp. SDUM812002]
MLARLRKSFFSGLILLAPIGITFFVFNWLVIKVGGNVKEPILKLLLIPENLVSRESLTLVWDTLATIIVLLAITLLGFLSRYFIAKYLFSIGERFLNNVPIINTVYTSVKQIVDTFSSQNRAVFQKVVLVEFPKEGCHALGFLTGDGKGEVQHKTDDFLQNVFVPTTPNPTSGFLVMMRKEDIQVLDMTVGQGMKLIISGGAVAPPYPPVENSLKFREAKAPQPLQEEEPKDAG